MARDFPSPLANVFDRHPPLEVLFEKVADQPLRAVSATPSDNIETKQSRRDVAVTKTIPAPLITDLLLLSFHYIGGARGKIYTRCERLQHW